MKVKINCPKCGSPKIAIVANPDGTSPMYKCEACGYKNNLFPQLGKRQNGDEESGE